MKRKKIPAWLQSTLWSVKVEDLNLEKDKVYIINQILAYGDMEELKWLFHTYPKKIIKKIFIQFPIKTYSAPAFNFAKEILLEIRKLNLLENRYVVNTPRIIR